MKHGFQILPGNDCLNMGFCRLLLPFWPRSIPPFSELILLFVFVICAVRWFFWKHFCAEFAEKAPKYFLCNGLSLFILGVVAFRGGRLCGCPKELVDNQNLCLRWEFQLSLDIPFPGNIVICKTKNVKELVTHGILGYFTFWSDFSINVSYASSSDWRLAEEDCAFIVRPDLRRSRPLFVFRAGAPQ